MLKYSWLVSEYGVFSQCILQCKRIIICYIKWKRLDTGGQECEC